MSASGRNSIVPFLRNESPKIFWDLLNDDIIIVNDTFINYESITEETLFKVKIKNIRRFKTLGASEIGYIKMLNNLKVS